jgi:hypothetical protein
MPSTPVTSLHLASAHLASAHLASAHLANTTYDDRVPASLFRREITVTGAQPAVRPVVVEDPAALPAGRFFDEFLTPNRPVILRNALAGWVAAPPWDLASLAARFGAYRVPLYDTLFSLQKVARFDD